MIMNFLCILVYGFFVFLFCILEILGVKYEFNWVFFDLCFFFVWYDKLKIGIFIYWGVFFVFSYFLEWFWYVWKGQKILGVVDFMQKNYLLDFIYVDFVFMFIVEFYNFDQWVEIFKVLGVK